MMKTGHTDPSLTGTHTAAPAGAVRGLVLANRTTVGESWGPPHRPAALGPRTATHTDTQRRGGERTRHAPPGATARLPRGHTGFHPLPVDTASPRSSAQAQTGPRRDPGLALRPLTPRPPSSPGATNLAQPLLSPRCQETPWPRAGGRDLCRREGRGTRSVLGASPRPGLGGGGEDSLSGSVVCPFLS